MATGDAAQIGSTPYVMGDACCYVDVISRRPVETIDFMTASFAYLNRSLRCDDPFSERPGTRSPFFNGVPGAGG